jgi:hypothetical protein
MMDFNTAERSTAGVIPKGTILPVVIAIQGGGADMPGMGPNDSGAFKMTKADDAYMLVLEQTVIAGTYKGRKVWSYLGVKGNGSDGHDKWVAGSMSKLRGIVESSRGISPKDDSDKAVAGRKIDGFMDLNGMTYTAKAGIEAGEDGYEDKNILYAVTPDSKDYVAPGEAPAQAVEKPAPVKDTATPAWD